MATPPATPLSSQDSVVSVWMEQGIMSKVQRNKLVFIETRDSGEISMALRNYFLVRMVATLDALNSCELDWRHD